MSAAVASIPLPPGYLTQGRIQDSRCVGAQTLQKEAPTYDFAKFSQKLHEIERIWTAVERVRVPRAPFRSATATPPGYQTPRDFPCEQIDRKT